MIVPADYLFAVLHLAWSLDLTTQVRTLAFGWLELLPAEVPPPDEDTLPGADLPGGQRRVEVQRVVVPAASALAWYAETLGGTAGFPHLEAHPGLLAMVPPPAFGPFDEDVAWPQLTCVQSNGTVTPFVPNDLGCVRAHHALPSRDITPRALWPLPDEAEAALAQLRDQLHFDLAESVELTGSLHVVAPNPVAREVRTRRVPIAEAGGGFVDAVAIHVETRTGFESAGLKLVWEETQPWGVIDRRTVDLSDGNAVVEFDRQLGGHQSWLLDDKRGVLEVIPSACFVSEIVTNFELVQVRQFQASAGERRLRRKKEPSPEVSFQVAVSSEPETMRIGRPAETSARERLHQLHYRRTASGKRRLERWFGGGESDAKGALELVRTLINRGRSRVWIVDAYVAGDELWNHGFNVGSKSVALRLLTAWKTLKGPCDKEGFATQGEALLGRIQVARQQKVSNPIEVRATRKNDPDVHDRFLVVDDNVYVLGSSLNDFGRRAAMLIELERPEQVLPRLEELWTQAQSLDDWFAERQANPQATIGLKGAVS